MINCVAWVKEQLPLPVLPFSTLFGKRAHRKTQFIFGLNNFSSVSPILVPSYKRPVYIFAFGEYNSIQLNDSGIKIFCAQKKEMLNAANIYLYEIILTKCKYIYRSFCRWLFKHRVTLVTLGAIVVCHMCF